MANTDEPDTTNAQTYEFTGPQNEIIRSSAFWITTWGAFTLIGGGANLLGAVAFLFQGGLAGVVGGILLGLVALIPVLIGLEFVRTGKALGAVVRTEGDDIDHLMAAVGTLGSAFRIQIVAIVSWIAFLMVVMVVFVETQVRGP